MRKGGKMTKTKLMKLANVSTQAFLDKVKEKYVEKYAEDMVKLLEDQKKLQKALDKVNKYVQEVESGDFTAIERYKKARATLEIEENAELE